MSKKKPAEIPGHTLPLPPVPPGWDKWENMGTGWAGPLGKSQWWAVYEAGKWTTYWNMDWSPSGFPNAHYIRAIKRRAAKPAMKLTPPANAPEIPKGWVYMGEAWKSGRSVRFKVWEPEDAPGWHHCTPGKTLGIKNRHYITPAPKPAKKKPAPAKAKRAGDPVKARRQLISKSIMSARLTDSFVLPADADSVEKMVGQLASVIGKAYGLAPTRIERELAREALASIGITATGANK